MPEHPKFVEIKSLVSEIICATVSNFPGGQIPVSELNERCNRYAGEIIDVFARWVPAAPAVLPRPLTEDQVHKAACEVRAGLPLRDIQSSPHLVSLSQNSISAVRGFDILLRAVEKARKG